MSLLSTDTQTLGIRLRILAVLYDRDWKAVARDAGVAPETISRVLAGAQRGSPALVARIERAIRGAS